MKIEVNLNKKFLVFSLIIGLLVVGFVGVYAYNSAGAPAVMGHSVNEIDWSQTIAGSVKAGGFCIGTNCITAWPSAGANLVAGSGIILTSVNGGMMINATATGGGGGTSSQWMNVSGGLIYDGGSVGIGVASPSQKLDVAGYVRAASGFCIGESCKTGWGHSVSFTDCEDKRINQGSYSCPSGKVTTGQTGGAIYYARCCRPVIS